MSGSEHKQKWMVYAGLALVLVVVTIGGLRILQRTGVIPEFGSRGAGRMAAPRTELQPPMVNGEVKEAPLPPVPRIQAGCEGECCGQLNSRKFLKATPLLEKPEANSPLVKEAAEGSEFKEAKHFVRVLKHGKAIVREDVKADGGSATADLAVGDELDLISYEGEGFFLVWAKGKLRVISIDPPAYEIQSEAETESWVEITMPDGKKGWALAPELDWGFC